MPKHVGVLVLEDHGARLEEEVAPPHDRLHRGDAQVEQPQRHGVLVHHVVEEVPARAPLVEAPAVAFGTQRGLEGGVGLADQRADAQGRRLADGAVGHQALRQLERGIVDEALADAQGAADPLGHRLHLERVLDRVGHRLLDGHVLARLERGDDVVAVQVGGREHLHGVDRVVGQHGGQVGVEGLRPPLLGRLAAHLLVGVAHGDDVATGILEVAAHVHGRDVAGAQHAQPDPLHDALLVPATA